MVAATETFIRETAGKPAATAARQPLVYRFSPLSIGLFVAGTLALCVPFTKALDWLWVVWTQMPEYSHGPMMPLIAAFLAWQQKDRLERLPFDGSWWGPVLLLVSGVVLIVGKLGSVITLQQYALITGFAGLLLAATGGKAFRALLAPVFVLYLMVPQAPFVLSALSGHLQLLSSQLGVAFIRAFGITVFAEGNVIDLGVYKLQVVEACDGLRYLFPLMAIGLLIAYFYKGAMWKRVLVFLASIPITLLMNSLRVGTIGVLVEHWGVGMAEGFLHEFQGWMVFMLSAAMLIGLTALLNRVGTETGTWRQLFGLEFPAPTPEGAVFSTRPIPASFLAALLVVLGISGAALAIHERGDILPERESFQAFPSQVGEWRGRRNAIEPQILDQLQLDDYVQMDFIRPSGELVNFYVAYYASQRDRRSAHSPRACLPGGGWQIADISTVTIPGTQQRANRMLITNGEMRQLVYYWFPQRGRTLTNELLVKWYLFWDAVTQRRTDGALVRLMTPVSATEPIEQAEERLAGFAAGVLPTLPDHVPTAATR
jgi:exosortase D (VPLPA-CTERM-specific)